MRERCRWLAVQDDCVVVDWCVLWGALKWRFLFYFSTGALGVSLTLFVGDVTTSAEWLFCGLNVPFFLWRFFFASNLACFFLF